MDDPTPPPPAEDDIVTTLEFLLGEARAGRVLFFLASVGHIAPPEPAPPPAEGETMLDALARHRAKPSPFRVSVGAFLGRNVSHLHPDSLESAYSDILRGAAHGQQKMTEAVSEEVQKRREFIERSS